MNFKSTTIFEKYSISPNMEKEKIKILFQTDVTKRKDLPVVLKVISSDEKLYEEELFTINENEEKLSKHTKLNKLIKDKDFQNNIKEISKIIVEIANDDNYYENFFYANKISAEKAAKIFEEYILCIIDKIMHEFLGSLGEISNDSLKTMFTSINSIYDEVEKFKNKKEDFIEELCDYLNNLLTLDGKNKELTKKFISMVFLNKLLKNDYYSNSIKYLIEKMNKKLGKYEDVLIDSYEYISSSFKGEDLKVVSSFLITLISENLNLRARESSSEEKESFKKLKKLQKCCILYDKNQYKSIKNDEYKSFEQLCDFMLSAGEEWKENYNEAFKNMIKESSEKEIYKIVSMIVQHNPTDEVLRIFSNVITEETGFNSMVEYILSTHEKSINHTSDKYINPTDVDIFIAKYYWLAYTKFNENINKTFFDKIRSIGFDILAAGKRNMDILSNRYSSYYAKMSARREVLSYYAILPGDWEMGDGKTIKQMFRELGETFTGEDGVSVTYIRNYDLLFKQLSKRLSELYYCPDCNGTVEIDDIKCKKCGCSLDWDNIDRSNEIEDTQDSTSDSNSEDKGVGCLAIFVILFIVFIILAIANSQ